MTYPVLLGAVVLTSANNRIRFREAGGAVFNADVAVGTYYLRGDGISTDLCLAIKTAIETGASANVYEVGLICSIDAASKGATLYISRVSGADTFGIVVDGSTTFDMDLIGFPASTANDATSKSSTVSCAAAWVSNDGMGELEPFSERVASVTRSMSGRLSGVSRSARMQSWRTRFLFVDERRLLIEQALAGTQDTLEGFIELFGAGAALEFHDVNVSSGTTLAALSTSTLVDVMHFSEDALTRFEPQRVGPGVPLYHLPMVLHAQVTT